MAKTKTKNVKEYQPTAEEEEGREFLLASTYAELDLYNRVRDYLGLHDKSVRRRLDREFITRVCNHYVQMDRDWQEAGGWHRHNQLCPCIPDYCLAVVMAVREHREMIEMRKRIKNTKKAA